MSATIAPLVLLVNGLNYTRWEILELQRSLEATAAGFNATVTNPFVDNSQFAPIEEWDLVTVLLYGEPVLTGYVTSFNAGFGLDRRILTISGFDATKDLDCAAIIKQWRNSTAKAIIDDLLAPYGIPFATTVDLSLPLAIFSTEPGDSTLDALRKLTEAVGVLLFPDGLGGLVASHPSTTPEAITLTEGDNLLSFGASFSVEDLHSTITVLGQQQGAGRGNNGIKASVTDASVPRYRPLVITATGQGGIAQCQQQAQWERASRNGKALTATATVQGWQHTAGGKLWQINQAVAVEAPSAFVSETLIIQAISYHLSEEGSTTTLQLVRPEALISAPIEAPAVKQRKQVKRRAKTS
jgi:prophage tail gpP-like protein